MITPIWVAAAVSVGLRGITFGVGIKRLRQTEVQHLHRAVLSDLDVGGFQIAVYDASLVSRFEGFGDLFGDGQGFVERDRSLLDAICEGRPLDEFKHECAGAFSFFQSVNGRDVWVVQ